MREVSGYLEGRNLTLGEGKKKVYEIIDEYSSGGEITVDQDIENKMADFFDIAQKDLARICPVVRLFAPEVPSAELEMPEDFLRVKTVWRNGKPYRGYRWKAGKLLVTDGAAVEIEYIANPATVSEVTPDSYAFEIDDNAAQALPYFVAANQLIVDLVLDYGAVYAIWERMKQELAIRSSGVNPGLTNTLYR